MFYLNSEFLILISIPLIIMFNIFYFKSRKRSNLNFFTKHLVWKNLFMLYILMVINVTMFPLLIDAQRTVDVFASINLIPLKETISSFNDLLSLFSTIFAIRIFLINVLGNIILFMPLGFLLPIINQNFNNIKSIFKISLFSTISIESIQFITSLFGGTRATDIDDIILNVLGGLLGFLIFVILSKIKIFKAITN